MNKEAINTDEFKIVGQKVVLRSISLDYAPNIFKELTTEVVRFLALEFPPSNIEDTLSFINASILQRMAGTDLVMVILVDGDFTGVAGLHKINTPYPRIGLWLKVAAQGKGYAKDVVKALIIWARKYLNFDSISYSTYHDNIASIKIIESLGGHFDRFDQQDPTLKHYSILP